MINDKNLTTETQVSINEPKKLLYLAHSLIILGTATAILFSAVLALCVRNTEHSRSLEAVYQKSLYEVCDNISNIETKLTKLVVSQSSSQSAVIASEIWRQADNASSNLAQLPLDTDCIIGATRALNQTGDFCFSLSKRLARGEKMSEAENEQIEAFHQCFKSLGEEMEFLTEALNAKYSIIKNSNRHRYSDALPFSRSFMEMQSPSINYPAVIYDGPFSDSMTDKPFGFLEGLEEYSAQESLAYVRKMLGEDAVFLGEAGGSLQTYEFVVGDYYAQITKKGRILVMLNSNRVVSAIKLGEEEAKNLALEYAKDFGFYDMEAMWYNELDGIAYVNLVAVVGNVRIYPDMIKLKIALDDGSLLGLESMQYCKNHGAREVSLKPTISLNTAKSMLSKRLKVQEHRLVLIPIGKKEVLAYEFVGDYKDYIYHVYIDAYDGSQLDIKRVVSNLRGSLQE